jgi:OmpA-OmpF porin, OOP family
VKNWLVENGIRPDRLRTKGYGDTQPIADNQTVEGRQRNRRVEFSVLNQMPGGR